MTVIANKTFRTGIMGSILGHTSIYGNYSSTRHEYKVIHLFSGAMPASLIVDSASGDPFAPFMVDHAANLIGTSGALGTEWSGAKQAWEATVIPDAITALVAGPVTWFCCEVYGEGKYMSFFISDSIALSGTTPAMLLLDNLSPSIGNPVNIIDFSLGVK